MIEPLAASAVAASKLPVSRLVTSRLRRLMSSLPPRMRPELAKLDEVPVKDSATLPPSAALVNAAQPHRYVPGPPARQPATCFATGVNPTPKGRLHDGRTSPGADES